MNTPAEVTTTPADDLIAAAMNEAAKTPPAEPQMPHAALPSPPGLEADAPMVSSPTLAALDPRRRPRMPTVCEGCPNSVWFTSPTEVKCYCRVMYLVTWSLKEQNQITACDGIFVGQDD
jgi:hypothetical protein